MEKADPRAALAALVAERGEDYAALSRLIGRNPAYVQQFIRRGTPKRLAERDRAMLARYFGVPETWLGAPEDAAAPAPALTTIPRLDVGASAGPGGFAEDRRSSAGVGFSESWLRDLRRRGGTTGLSMIRVAGTSMLPTLADGDEILVDGDDAAGRLRDGIYVLRAGGILLVKRLVREGDGFAVKSDNPDADPVDLGDPSSVAILGRVLWTGRRL
jgi:phage repressor protein C with HTH and peptisase S24 domain